MSKQYWEILADEIHVAGWSYGYTRAIFPDGKFYYIADAHKNDGCKYVAQAETLLTTFMELQNMLPKKETTK